MKKILLTLAVLAACMCSCTRESAQGAEAQVVTDSLGLNDSVVMPYVECSPNAVARCFAIGDSVYARTGKYTLEDLGYCDDDRNEYLMKTYGDTVAVVVSLYDSYDRITLIDTIDEVDAALVWHQVAKAQMLRFLNKGGDVEHVLYVAERLAGSYSCGTQGDMTMSAYRMVTVADYRLLDAYKRLIDCYPSAEVKQLAREDYRFVLERFRNYEDLRYEEESYSDLSRELQCIFYQVLMSKADALNALLQGNAAEAEVLKNLRDHTCLVDGQPHNLTDGIAGHYYGD